MKVLLGALFLAAVFGFGIYKAFIDPSYSVNVGESIDWTEACVDGDPELEIDGDTTDQLTETIAVEGLAIHEPSGPATVFVFFLQSESDAARSREDLVSAGGREYDADVDQRGALVFAHPEISDTEAEETYGPCLVEVADNKWGAWTGFETKRIGRPFDQAGD
jgi:hypothetical protein